MTRKIIKYATRILAAAGVVAALLLFSRAACPAPVAREHVIVEHSVVEGIASMYGGQGDGFLYRMMASGTRYLPGMMICAHRTLPFGTKLRVTNPKTNQSVVVTVMDRGPFINGRVLDLSFAAGHAIGLKGCEPIRMAQMRSEWRKCDLSQPRVQ